MTDNGRNVQNSGRLNCFWKIMQDGLEFRGMDTKGGQYESNEKWIFFSLTAG